MTESAFGSPPMPAEALDHRHVSEDSILDYVEGRAEGAGRERVEEHLDACDECRQLVAELAQSSLLLSDGATPWNEGTPTEPRGSQLPKPGALLSERFRIVKALGHGAMGLVYEATDEALGVNVAIKVFWPTLGADERVVESIRREASLGRRIHHPNVRRVFDVGTSSGLTFLTMQLIEGETLEERLKRGPVTESEAIAMLAQVCDGLTAAHDAGIVHRDLKPGNIAIDQSGRVIVMDFGLARDVNAQASRRQGRGLVGTPAYWSPEQSRGEAATACSDIYSLGLITYLLLSGEHFSLAGGNKLASPLRAIVDRCLEQKPQRRYPTAAAVRDALVSARRSRAQLVFGGVALVAIIALAGGLALRSRVAPVESAPLEGIRLAPSAAQASAAPTAASHLGTPTSEAAPSAIPIDALLSTAPSTAPSHAAASAAQRRAAPAGSTRQRPSEPARRPAVIAGASAAASSPAPPAIERPFEGVAPQPPRVSRPIDREDPYGAH